MKKSAVICIVFTAVFLLGSFHHAYAIGLEVAGGAWGQNPSGDISYKSEAVDDKLDIEDNLKYDREYKAMGRAKIDVPGMLPNIYFIATLMKFEETGAKSVDFTFGDQTFNVAAPFTSLLQLHHYDIAFYYSLPFLSTASTGKLNVDLGINARIVDFKAEVTGEDLSGGDITESEKFTIPVPMIYAGLQINATDRVSLEGEFRGIAYDSNHYYDFIGRIKIKPVAQIFIAGGYRHENIEIDHEDIKASMTFKGPFAEAGLEF